MRVHNSYQRSSLPKCVRACRSKAFANWLPLKAFASHKSHCFQDESLKFLKGAQYCMRTLQSCQNKREEKVHARQQQVRTGAKRQKNDLAPLTAATRAHSHMTCDFDGSLHDSAATSGHNRIKGSVRRVFMRARQTFARCTQDMSKVNTFLLHEFTAHENCSPCEQMPVSTIQSCV